MQRLHWAGRFDIEFYPKQTKNEINSGEFSMLSFLPKPTSTFVGKKELFGAYAAFTAELCFYVDWYKNMLVGKMEWKTLPIFFVAISAVLVAGCVADNGDGDVSANIVASDQNLADSQITLNRVDSPQDAWIAVFSDSDGERGELLGYAPVNKGQNSNVRVNIDINQVQNISQSVIVQLFSRQGGVNTFDVNVSQPITVNNSVVVKTIVITRQNGGGNGDGQNASIDVADQNVLDDTVTVSSVTSPQRGWIVIHRDENGQAGEILGFAQVQAGNNANVVVDINGTAEPGTQEQLTAMLHTDAGQQGTFEFPNGADAPVTEDGEIVQEEFTVTWQESGGLDNNRAIVNLRLIAQGFTSPVAMASPDDGTGRLFVADQTGLIYALTPNGNGSFESELLLDLSENLVPLQANYDERGLLGLALHPDFGQNGKFYAYYTAPLREGAPSGFDHTNRVSEFTLPDVNSNVADLNSERIILEIDNPQFNHNAGHIIFGPDNYLYVPTGDGGGSYDISAGHNPSIGNAQDKNSLLGKILRIDVDSQDANGLSYAIPSDNPFINGGGRPEIFALGFRNPFHLSFDSFTGRLYASDAGQSSWEEINLVEKGRNYGWNIKEGSYCTQFQQGQSPYGEVGGENSTSPCPGEEDQNLGLTDPVIQYQNAAREGGIGSAVIGGYVYRGQIQSLYNRYIFGDLSMSLQNPQGLLLISEPVTGTQELLEASELQIGNSNDGRLNMFVKAFGTDSQQEIYVLTSGVIGPGGTTGKVYKLTESTNNQNTSNSQQNTATDPNY